MKNLSILSKTLLLAVVLSGAACKKSVSDVTVTEPTNELAAPAGFNFETSKTINLSVKLLAPNGEALKGVMVHVYDDGTANNANEIFTGITDESGIINEKIVVPSRLQTVVVDPEYIGIIRQAKVAVLAGSADCTLGGANGYAGNVIPVDSHVGPNQNDAQLMGAFNYKYMGKYNSEGRPDYLVKPNDVIDSKLLEFVNASLPESRPVPTNHPDYLNYEAQTNLVITEKSDVWITFVHEGAGYQNALAYYTYPTGKAPAKPEDITNLTIVLPNASLRGSGGDLESGNKVNLGRIDAGTTIAFAVVANGWNYGSKFVGTGYHTVYSDDKLNPEPTPELRRHTVLLHDAGRNLFLVGFEDLRRDQGSDNDFNDLIFYGTSNPVKAISTEDVNPIDTPVDTDNDGVSDVYDRFPTDPTRAYIQYFPSKNTFGTLAFEDLWPATGDYDMNDLVVDYRYAVIKNGKNKVVEMNSSYTVKAIGASFKNGLGIEFPFSPSVVKSVTSGILSGNFPVKITSNGLEAGQSKAVIIPFDNAYKLTKKTGGFVNTMVGEAFVNSDTVNMMIAFTNPIDLATLGTFPFNPFLVSNGKRGVEVHLPGSKPTDLADKKLLNTGADNTNPAENKYYKTKKNLPFALSFVEKFNVPVEKTPIQEAYLKYTDWVKSGGLTLTDWYSNTSAGYRVSSKIIEH